MQKIQRFAQLNTITNSHSTPKFFSGKFNTAREGPPLYTFIYGGGGVKKTKGRRAKGLFI